MTVRILLLLSLIFLARLTIWPALAQTVPAPGVGIVASSGTVAAATATATLAGTANRVTYLCGFAVSGLGATAGSNVVLAVTGLASGTVNINVGVPAGATVPINQGAAFSPCLPSNGPNTAVVLTLPSLGTGNTAADITAWGYQGN